MERDFYYEPNMHGLDWDAMKEKYGEAASVRHRAGRTSSIVIGELIGELNTSHTYVFGGDRQRDGGDGRTSGMLGVDWSVDAESEPLPLREDLPGTRLDATRSSRRSPAPAFDVKEGDYLLR